MRTTLLTILALFAFAANSLLCRAALGDGHADPGAFTLVRILSGAIVLALLVGRGVRGRWSMALMLFLYAAAFSLAYVRLEAGVGALILFGSVQLTMASFGWLGGERPRLTELLGAGVALGGLLYLVLPGISAPPLGAAATMALAGAAWGGYSLMGRGSPAPLADTAGNFLRAVPMVVLGVLLIRGGWRLDRTGLALAIASGAFASGLGYVAWYAALRRLRATRAAIVQLSVPVIAAAGGALWLAETPSLRLVIGATVILGGIALGIGAKLKNG